MVVVAEGRGGATLLLLEDAVEVADVVESALVAYLRHVDSAVHQEARGMAEPNVDDVVGDGLARPHPEETAEGGRRHAGDVGEGLKPDFLLEVLVDVFLHPPYPLALGRVLDVGEGLAGKQVVVGLEGEFVQNLQQAQHAVESRLRIGDVRQLAIKFHNGRQLEGNSSLGILEHRPEAAELVLGKELLAQQVERELNGNLVDGMALAVVLVPGVLQAAAHENEVVPAEHLDGIAYDSPCPVAILHEIEFHLVMLVQWIGESLLVPVHHVEAILL